MKEDSKNKKTMLSSQELALYYGCQVKIKVKDQSDIPYEDGIRKLDGFLIDWIQELDSIKPILRPLSDITEKEAMGWLHALYGHWGWQVDLIAIDKPFIKFRYHSGRRWSKIKVTHCNRMPDCARTVAFLLSCGFDLFDYTEKGVALNKTKLKKS